MPKHLFTAETAVIAAKLSHLPTSARYKQEPAQTPTAQDQQPADNSYTGKVLLKVRGQLDKVSTEIDSELDKTNPDHRKLKELVLTQSSLAELERKLSMRPEPGSLKPRQNRPDRGQPGLSPTAARPAQNQPEPAQTPQPIDFSGYSMT